MRNTLLSIKDLKTYFYTYVGVVHALNGVNLEVYENEWLGIVGETGSGKSVTAMSLLKLVPPPGKIESGEVIFDNENILDKNDAEIRKVRGAKISMVFQDPSSSLNPLINVGFQISETTMWHQHLKKPEATKKALEMLERVGIPSPDKRMLEYPHQLSGGMKQRVMIAIALSLNPKLLIADEPTTNLDVTTQAQIIYLMKDLQKEFKNSVILITHNLGVVSKTTDRVAVMYAGRVVEKAPTREIFKNPKHPYTIGLMATLPSLKAEWLEAIPGTVPSLLQPPTGCQFASRCKSVMDKCWTEDPEPKELNKDHWVECHLY